MKKSQFDFDKRHCLFKPLPVKFIIWRAPVALLTLVLDGSSHEPTAGIMVAHEMVHVLGRWSFMSEWPTTIGTRRTVHL